MLFPNNCLAQITANARLFGRQSPRFAGLRKQASASQTQDKTPHSIAERWPWGGGESISDRWSEAKSMGAVCRAVAKPASNLRLSSCVPQTLPSLAVLGWIVWSAPLKSCLPTHLHHVRDRHKQAIAKLGPRHAWTQRCHTRWDGGHEQEMCQNGLEEATLGLFHLWSS